MPDENALPGDELAPELPGDEAEVPGDEAALPDADAPPPEDAEVGDEKLSDAEPVAPPADKDDEEDESPVAKKYAKERDEISVKYQKAVVELREVTDERNALAATVEGSKREARKAVRYQKLTELAGLGYLINPEEEIAEVQEMADGDFNKYTERVVKHYQRIPQGTLPVPKGVEVDADGKHETRISNEAFAMCEKATKLGQYMKFADAVETVRKSYQKAAA